MITDTTPTMEQAKRRYSSHTRKVLVTATAKYVAANGRWTTVDGYPSLVDRGTGKVLIHFRLMLGSKDLCFGILGPPALFRAETVHERIVNKAAVCD